MRMVIDPFTRLGFEIEIKIVGEGLFRAEGFLTEKNRRESLCQVVLIQPGHPPKVQRGPLLQQLASDVDVRWLQRIYPRPAFLSEEELLQWHAEWKEEGEDAPHIVFPTFPEKKFEVWPVLKLKDRFGAFADLWMNYVGKGEISFHDTKVSHFRDVDAEKFWEKDLLDTGFQAKKMDSSHYYCPMDKVVSSLSFLLDIGWKIVDYHGKRVFHQGSAQLEIEEMKSSLFLRGKIQFGEHEVDVGNVVGACQKRERFFHLSENAVALIDEATLPSQLAEFSLDDGMLRLPKSRFAILEKQIFSISSSGSLLEILALASGKRYEKNVAPSAEFCGTLYPYQTHGLQWLSSLKEQNLAGLLADEMGLGKTVQVLAFLSLFNEDLPVLLVVPKSLLFHWKREWEKFLPERPLYVHSGPSRSGVFTGVSAILTSYALIRHDRELFASQEYSCIIVDEAQTVKNSESQIAEAICSLKANFRLAMSGTPVENRSEDLWSLFRFLLPELLGEKSTFHSRTAEYNKKLISPFILRRKKEVVAHQLPPKLEQIVWVDMGEEQRRLYENVLATSRQQIATGSGSRLQILEKILRLRQICCHPALIGESLMSSGKLEKFMEDLEEIVAEGRKALIYSQFTSMLRLIQEFLDAKGWKASYLDGSTSHREEAVRQFQEDSATVFFLISLKAGGVGLNLTQADDVLLFDPWWNEAVERQAIDRAHRLGREAPVMARRYVTALSIEEKMMKLKEYKKKLVGDLLEDAEASALSIEDLLLLLE